MYLPDLWLDAPWRNVPVKPPEKQGAKDTRRSSAAKAKSYRDSMFDTGDDE